MSLRAGESHPQTEGKGLETWVENYSLFDISKSKLARWSSKLEPELESESKPEPWVVIEAVPQL